ncbi:unnamed protein product [Pieris macdunnoughi]|uniref:Uncharacterized protein n=1 Tax=Pieris macdunnoughi TaxID=345717 RepID=A0A821W5E7_9NEOP|nr:unnamed protein product [Pieris macdunnoughi]
MVTTPETREAHWHEYSCSDCIIHPAGCVSTLPHLPQIRKQALRRWQIFNEGKTKCQIAWGVAFELGGAVGIWTLDMDQCECYLNKFCGVDRKDVGQVTGYSCFTPDEAARKQVCFIQN